MSGKAVLEKAHLVDDFGKNKLERSPANSTDSLGSSFRHDEIKPMASVVEETPHLKVKRPDRCLAIFCRRVVDHPATMFFTTILTFYALTASDIQAIATESPTDFAWMLMTIFTFSIFCIEIIMTLIGKSDYFASFFFWLDLISTLTLLLDITVISTWIFSGLGGVSGASNLRSGRTARVGARAGRVVRVLRLVRLLKLYKAYLEAQRKRQEALKGELAQIEKEDDWEDEEEDEENNDTQESKVGKKLIEMTLRRVICLILALLLGLPQLEAQQVDQLLTSAQYGADTVWQAFYNYAYIEGDQHAYANYQNAMLNYIYYHNWYANNAKNAKTFCPTLQCSNAFYAHLFWVGIIGPMTNNATFAIEAAKLDPSYTTYFNNIARSNASNYNLLQQYGFMPDRVAQTALPANWSRQCLLTDQTPVVLAHGISILDDSAGGEVKYTVGCPNDLRASEVVAYTPSLMTDSQANQYVMVFYFDARPFTHEDSAWSLGVLSFVMVMLVGGALVFSADANRLILHPMEKMMDRVEAIRRRPLIAMKMADDEFKSEEIARAKLAKQSRLETFLKNLASGQCMAGQAQVMETVVLEKTIIKLGSLLALGFGEAGADIIGQTMRGGESAGVNAMIPGKRVECIIGSVRISNFSVATEVLQTNVMNFGNQVAEIVHGVCLALHGAPNKNSGEQFLIIWKFDTGRHNDGSAVSGGAMVTRFAELSVYSFCSILGAVHASEIIASYGAHPRLKYRLGRPGVRNRISTSFGLHKGWAIEGAVGSEYKIDASYLSPNVSVAQAVELSTEYYAVSLMLAQSVYVELGTRMKQKCRLLDTVVITGARDAMNLYCVDLDYTAVSLEPRYRPKVPFSTRQRFKVRQSLATDKLASLRLDYSVVDMFEAEPSIVLMRSKYTVEFFQLFSMGFQNYAQGEWQVARRMLSCTRSLLGTLGTEDGPSVAILTFMEEKYQFEAPKGWTGVRQLVLGAAAQAEFIFYRQASLRQT